MGSKRKAAIVAATTTGALAISLGVATNAFATEFARCNVWNSDQIVVSGRQSPNGDLFRYCFEGTGEMSGLNLRNVAGVWTGKYGVTATVDGNKYSGGKYRMIQIPSFFHNHLDSIQVS